MSKGWPPLPKFCSKPSPSHFQILGKSSPFGHSWLHAGFGTFSGPQFLHMHDGTWSGDPRVTLSKVSPPQPGTPCAAKVEACLLAVESSPACSAPLSLEGCLVIC